MVSVLYRYEKTKSGYDFDLVKSALQKYIRRGDPLKAYAMYKEIEVFKGMKDGQKLYTNFINRIKITAFEDVGLFADIEYIDTLLEANNITKLISYLSLMPHTRFYSHISNLYYEKELQYIKSPNFSYKLEGNQTLKIYVDNMIFCIENKKVDVIYWIKKILSVEKLDEPIKRNSRPGFLIFDILKKIIKDKKFSKLLDTCEKWYKNLKLKEDFLCVIHPVYLYILYDAIDYEKWNNIVKNHIESYNLDDIKEKKFEIDDYAYDKHTKVGKKLGRNTAQFAFEGSLVSFDVIISQDIIDYYINTRIESGQIFKETEEFQFKCRSQINTADFKQDVYFAKNKIGQNVVVKGPYLYREDVLYPLKIRHLFNLLPGVNTFDINVKVLYPDMFKETPLGIRRKTEPVKYYYFLVFEDLINREEYPVLLKNTKKWKDTYVADYDSMNIKFGKPSNLNEEELFSLLLQISIRELVGIGDFASRNFIVVNGKAYNLDLEKLEKIAVTENRMAKKEKLILDNCLNKNKEKFLETLKIWKNNKLAISYAQEILNIDLEVRIDNIICNVSK